MKDNDTSTRFWKSEDCFRSLLNNALPGILVAHSELKRFEYANPAICRMLGYTNTEILALSVPDIHPADALDEVIREFDAQARGEKDVVPCLPFLRKDGKIIYCSVCANGMDVDGVTYNIGVIIDVTEQKRAQDALKNSEDRYGRFFEKSTDAMLIIENGLFVDCNAATVKMLEYETKEELLNTSPWALSPEYQPDGRRSDEKAMEMMQKAFSDGAHHFEWSHKKKGGGIVPVEVSLTAIPGDGEDILHTVWRDLTERKNAEAEIIRMQKLKSIGTLAGGIAHDFNNVLCGIFGNISLAKMKLEADHSAYELLQDAEVSMLRATNLTNQLLTFSRGGDPIKETTSIGKLVKDITSFTLSGSRVRSSIEEADGLWNADVDKGQIEQVISNLIINADQSMPDGGNVFITLENADISKSDVPGLPAGKYIRIAVRDEGVGIESKYLNRVFDPYFSTKHAGNGLGLATAHSIIERHHGYLAVASEVGRGSIFTCYLPATGNQDAPGTEADDTTGPFSRKGGRILVMDDEEQVRVVVEKLLQMNRYLVDLAVDGKQAIEKYVEALKDERPYDAVLMDLTIPGGMGGQETVREILKIDPAAKVIVFSGYSNNSIMAEYVRYGFRGRLVKPFRAAGLMKEVARVIELGDVTPGRE